jgi:hypothetical protein
MKISAPRKIIYALIIFLVFLELSLQAAHLIVLAARPAPKLGHAGAPVILCAGDSHTYGYMLAEEESYPYKLQGLFDRAGIKVNVVNDGIPGQNSSELRRRLPELLDYYRPRIVIIQCDSNNDWNRQDTAWSDLEDGALAPGWRAWWVRAANAVEGSVRTFQLAEFLWNEYGRTLRLHERHEDRNGIAHFHRLRQKDEPWDSGKVLANRSIRDLTRMVDLVRQSGATPLLMNYVGQPEAGMTLANQFIADVAQARSVPVIDNDAAIRPLFWKEDGSFDVKERNRLFLPDPKETHLAGPGYTLAAENAFNVIMSHGLLGKNP